nr:hypothetical protein [Tanacetum cinerariifolium]
MFMANLSSADPVNDKAGPSYDSYILSEVHDHDHYQDAVCEHHEEHAMYDNVQLNHVVDSHADYTSDSNMIPYDQNVLYDWVSRASVLVKFSIKLSVEERPESRQDVADARSREWVPLDEEQLLFLAGGQDNAIDEDADEQPAPTAQTMFMANLSSADPVNDKAGPSYDSYILSECCSTASSIYVKTFWTSVTSSVTPLFVKKTLCHNLGVSSKHS